jgi:Mce-associated membrane protein
VVDADPPGPEPTRARWIGPVGTLLVVIIAVVSVVVCIVASLSWRSAVDADKRNAEVLDVASTMAVNLVTLGKQTADADLARVIDGTTGDFRDQFVSAADGFDSLLTDGGVDSTGGVKSAGIVDASDEQATVLAAVTSTVKNNEAPDGEVRVYRMKLTLDNVDGRWLVSNVEFVA